jgi:nicotinamidase-related amidase
MNTIFKNPALIIVDVQNVLDDPKQDQLNNPRAEKNIAEILDMWRNKSLPLFHIQYISPRKASPFHKDAPGSGLKESVQPLPGEPLIIKHFESAFMKTDLEDRLRKAGADALVFVGYYTDQCIASTAKVANNLGFKVFVAADAAAATGCRGYNGKYYDAEDIHQMTLGSLQRDGISIIETADLLIFFSREEREGTRRKQAPNKP